MRKGMISSYVEGIMDREQGESYSNIFGYLLPEFISAFMVYSLPFLIDSWFVCNVASTAGYATIGTISNFLHFLIKTAEGFQIGTVILAGRFNGKQEYKQVGDVVRDAFWLTCFLGALIAIMIYSAAYWIYWWYGVSPEIVQLGIPVIRLRAISVFLMFIYLALIGFLRAIKNTQTPMCIYTIGSMIFVLCDYILIYGKCGMPTLGILGSATAAVMQYVCMLTLAIVYIMTDDDCKKYSINLFSGVIKFPYIKQLMVLSLPVALDKATLAIAYMWLLKMLCPMGTCAIASYTFIKDFERFSFLPAIACAQVITFLVSNDVGMHNWQGIKTNIKKVGFVASTMVGTILAIFSLFRVPIISFFDRAGEFTLLTSGVFPVLSVLVFFDLVQLILSGALRGLGNVKVVMTVRMVVCFTYFIPISLFLSRLAIQDQMLKFTLIYGSFYIGNGLMSIAYIYFLRSYDWDLVSKQGTA